MGVLTPVLVILTLVVLNGLFVAAEFALVASKRTRLSTLAASGNGAARWLLGIFDRPNGKDGYIAIAQLVITLASIGLGMYGEPAIAKWLYDPFEQIGLSYAAAHTVGFVVALSFITFLHVVFGEMIPKALALQGPEAVSVRVNPVMRVFGVLFRPMVAVLSALALGLMRLLKVKEPGEEASLYTSKELAIVTGEVAASGQLNAVQTQLIQNVLELDTRTAEQLMTSRRHLEAVSVTTRLQDLVEKVAVSPRSRYVVFEGTLDQVVGVLHIKDVMRAQVQGQTATAGALARPLPSVTASAVAEDLLALFKRDHVHAALVVDEFGGTLGFVTMDDLLSEVLAVQEHDADWISVQADGSLLLNGGVTLAELAAHHQFPWEQRDVTTIAGLVLAVYGTVPPVGASVSVQGRTLTVKAVQGLQVTRVQLAPQSPTA
ncbi:hemolysin family protein [Deinococcus arboris]|nr:hemolysin family protein [Deinococcus arboris]